MTLPPPSYPSASPYYSLTKYFARLVKKKVITRQMLRKLLHERTWAKAFELTGMPVLRRHKNHIRLRIDNDGVIAAETEYSDSDDSDQDTESYASSSYTNTEASSSNKILRQDAMDTPRTMSSCSSWGSNFDYVHYFDKSNVGQLDGSQGIYKADCTQKLFNSIGGSNKIHNTIKTIGSGQHNHSSSDSANYLNPLVLHSESTDHSSFEVKPYMACEDLVNMDQNTQIELGNDEHDFIPTRRSFPNRSAKNDAVPKLWKSTEEDYTSHDDSAQMSLVSNVLQNLDPPSPKQIYSPIESIILDPPPMFRNDEENLKIINVNLNTNVPFRKHSLNSDKRIRRSMSRSMVESENYHRKDDPSLNRMSSQSERQKIHQKCECCNRSLCPSPRSSDSGVVGSCNLASPELNMHEYASSGTAGNESDSQEKGSHHAQDSLTNLSEGSFDSDRRKKVTLSEIEAAAFEEQCRCTSPFGSTARTSCVTSATSENSLDVMDSSNVNVTSTFASPTMPTPNIKRTSIRRNIERYVPVIKLKPDPPPRLYRKPSTHIELPKNVRQQLPCQWSTLNITEKTKPSLHYHMRIYRDPAEMKNTIERQSRVIAPRNRDLFGKENKQSVDANPTEMRKTRSRSEDLTKLQKGLAEAPSGFVVYRSDLYAHWWMKAKLPITVVTDSGKDYSFVKSY